MTGAGWFESNEKTERLLAEERLILEASERVTEALQSAGMNRAQLAKALGVTKTEVSQRLSGSRNLTLRTLADMLQAVGAEAHITLANDRPSTDVQLVDELQTRRVQLRRGPVYRQVVANDTAYASAL